MEARFHHWKKNIFCPQQVKILDHCLKILSSVSRDLNLPTQTFKINTSEFRKYETLVKILR